MPPMLWDAGVKRVSDRGYSTFSDYVQELIRQDSLRAAPLETIR